MYSLKEFIASTRAKFNKNVYISLVTPLNDMQCHGTIDIQYIDESKTSFKELLIFKKGHKFDYEMHIKYSCFDVYVYVVCTSYLFRDFNITCVCFRLILKLHRALRMLRYLSFCQNLNNSVICRQAKFYRKDIHFKLQNSYACKTGSYRLSKIK